MNDRDLLERAAKAAGLDVEWSIPERRHFINVSKYVVAPWNPLSDDGDALRLANKLRFRIVIENRCVFVDPPGGYWYAARAVSFVDGDVDVAMRRAITCAAAAMLGDGQSMGQPVGNTTETLPEPPEEKPADPEAGG